MKNSSVLNFNHNLTFDEQAKSLRKKPTVKLKVVGEGRSIYGVGEKEINKFLFFCTIQFIGR